MFLGIGAIPAMASAVIKYNIPCITYHHEQYELKVTNKQEKCRGIINKLKERSNICQQIEMDT